jgi:hypothetical protein
VTEDHSGRAAAAYASWAAAIAKTLFPETLEVEVSCLAFQDFDAGAWLARLVLSIIHELVPHVNMRLKTTNSATSQNGTTETGASLETRIETLKNVFEGVLKMYQKVIVVIGNC